MSAAIFSANHIGDGSPDSRARIEVQSSANDIVIIHAIGDGGGEPVMFTLDASEARELSAAIAHAAKESERWWRK